MIAWLNCEFAYALTLVFSLKKSFFKAAYSLVQCYFDFTAVEVQAIDATNGNVVAKVVENLTTTLSDDFEFTGHFSVYESYTISWVENSGISVGITHFGSEREL